MWIWNEAVTRQTTCSHEHRDLILAAISEGFLSAGHRHCAHGWEVCLGLPPLRASLPGDWWHAAASAVTADTQQRLALGLLMFFSHCKHHFLFSLTFIREEWIFSECWPYTADLKGSEEPAKPEEMKDQGENQEEHEVDSSYPEDPDEKLNLPEVVDLTVNTIANGRCRVQLHKSLLPWHHVYSKLSNF